MNAIRLLKQDHRRVEKLFSQFRSKSSRSVASAVQRLADELTLHARLEEKIVYPKARKGLPDGAGMVKEAVQEHAKVKKLVAAIKKLDPGDALRAKMATLEENVSHHVEEEEGELFPAMERELGREQLQQMGARIERQNGGTAKRGRRRATGRSRGASRTKKARATRARRRATKSRPQARRKSARKRRSAR
jgi:hemerythrin superfamily protein